MIRSCGHPIQLGVFALALIVSRPVTGLATGEAQGTLGGGGTATGDISRTAGETDRIAIDLVAGATLSVTFRATFAATLALTDPDATPIDLTLTGTGRKRGSVQVSRSGTYRFAITSSDGSQGIYKLSAKQTWPHVVAIGGTGTATVDVGMPAGGRLACTVSAPVGSPDSPTITHLVDPNGLELLSTPVVVHGRAAKLPPTTAGVTGIYALTVEAGATTTWSGRVLRHVPHASSVTIHLENGLDAISFKGDGVAMVFAKHCAPCHGAWALSYPEVRRRAFDAIARMEKGLMPPGGGLSRADIALVKAWISTGRKP
jgi:hypothetical protein